MAISELTPREHLLYKAIAYLLDRTQVDPDLAYALHDTQAWEYLIEAEANILALEVGPVRELRLQDQQPPYRRRRPTVVDLREQIDEYSAKVMALEEQINELS